MKRGLAKFCFAKNPRQAVMRLQLLVYLLFIALGMSLLMNIIMWNIK